MTAKKNTGLDQSILPGACPKQSTDDLSAIFDFISDGGSLTAYCRTNKLKYSLLLKQIKDNPILKDQYAAALIARDEWARESVLAELRLIALTDLRELFDEHGAMKPKDQWPETLARAISSVKVYEEFIGSGSDRRLVGYTKEIKLWDKQKSLDSLANTLGLLVDKSEVNVNISLQDILKEVNHRLNAISKN